MQNSKNEINEQKDLKQLKTTDIPKVRDEILKEQSGKCAICEVRITSETGYSLDHQHKTKSTPNGLDGAGLVRGVLCRSCNTLEGKIWNNTTRFMQPKTVQDRIDFLKKLVLYYNKKTYNFIHPTEKEPEKNLSKRQYNKLKKIHIDEQNRKKSGRAKFPDFPKSKKLTKPLEKLFLKHGISPYL